MSKLDFIDDKNGINSVSGVVHKCDSIQKTINTVKLIEKYRRAGAIVLMNFRFTDFAPGIEVGVFSGMGNNVDGRNRLFYIPYNFLLEIMPTHQKKVLGEKFNSLQKKYVDFFDFVSNCIDCANDKSKVEEHSIKDVGDVILAEERFPI